MQSGGTPKSNISKYYNGDIPFVSINDMTNTNKYLFKTKKTITDIGLRNSNAWIIKKNSLIYSMYATIGKPIINKIDVSTHQGILGIECDRKKIDNEFLFYALENIRNSNTLKKYHLTSTQSNISLGICKKITIIHPIDIIEQQKIVAILSSVDMLIEKTYKLLHNIIRLKKGYMQKLFYTNIGNDKTIFNNWKKISLKDITIKIVDKDHTTPKYVIKNGIPLISPINFINNSIDFSHTKFITKEYHHLISKKCLPTYGDLLLSRIGTIGKVRLVPKNIVFNILHSIVLIRPNRKYVNKKFLYYILQSKFVQDQMYHGVQSIGTPDLGINKIRKLQILLPPLKEQENIQLILSKFDKYIETIRQYEEKVKKLKIGLMRKLFDGELKVN